MPIRGKDLYPFRWFFRPEVTPFASPAAVPVVRVVENPEVEPDQVQSLLAEINARQWGALTAVLVEGKFKAEAQLRNEALFSDPGRVAFISGWVAYCDYIIASLQRIRSEPPLREPGPEPGPE